MKIETKIELQVREVFDSMTDVNEEEMLRLLFGSMTIQSIIKAMEEILTADEWQGIAEASEGCI